jgi:VWFA-related protein
MMDRAVSEVRMSGSSEVRWFAKLALLIALALPVQTQQQPQRAQGTVTEGVTAVLVDVVVRDRRGQPVRDLVQSDFEVLEDGVPQTIGSFNPQFERPAAAATGAPAVANQQMQTSRSGPGVTALVFDRLTPEARRRAAEAAKSYLGSKEESQDYIAVYGIDLQTKPFVPFTRNAVAIRKALDAIATSASAGFNSPESQRAIADATAAAAEAARLANSATSGATGPGASNAVGTAPAAAAMAEMQAAMLRDFETMERDQTGYATTDGLFAIVRSLARIPGRKSVVLFSEGIEIPAAVHRFYIGVIDAANRSNVSFYTMDAAGLRAESDQSKVRDAVNLRGAVGIETGYSSEGGGAFTQGLESNEYRLRSDPAYGLNELASSTGGLFFNNTNNLRPAFERVESDLRNYYLLGYTPSNTKFDGRFRKIEVRVKRPNVTLAARKGYFAVRNPGGTAVNEWEAPALAALEQQPVGNAFPVRAGAMLFPDRGRPGLVPVVVELKTAPLTFQPAADGKNYTSDFTVLVRFLDDKNQVARKVSQHYEIRGPIDQIERAKQGDVIFYRESELPSGVYTMETVVYDAPSAKSSVRFSTVEVPKHDEGKLRMSSLMIVKRGEKVAANDRPVGNPLLVHDVLLHPNLGEPISKASKELSFYFAIYPVPKEAKPESAIELLQNGTPVAQIPMPVAETDAAGRVQQVGRLPLEQLQPGTYEMRAIVSQGSTRLARSTLITIVN